jgi:hypothetical protein
MRAPNLMNNTGTTSMMGAKVTMGAKIPKRSSRWR